ncbi:MAG: hypothetical protein AB8B63_23475 [Granulosicoccus sp.]
MNQFIELTRIQKMVGLSAVDPTVFCQPFHEVPPACAALSCCVPDGRAIDLIHASESLPTEKTLPREDLSSPEEWLTQTPFKTIKLHDFD